MFITKEYLYTSSDIKREAKAQLSGRWGKVILLFLIPILLAPVFTVGVELVNDSFNNTFITVSLTGFIQNLLNFFLTTGAVYTLLDVVRERDYSISPLEDLLQAFRNDNFGPLALIYILKRVFVVLWSLLFVIPGIVKSYSYSQAEFLRRDYQAIGRDISSNDAITLSRELMHGYKADLFGLDLSFIGWYFLSIFTFGLLLIFVIPYHNAARTVFYQNISREHFMKLQ